MAGLEETVPASPPASRGGHGGDGAHGDKDARCGGEAVAGLVEWEGRERGQRGRREQVQREAGMEAAAEALEARVDGVLGVEECDAGGCAATAAASPLPASARRSASRARAASEE